MRWLLMILLVVSACAPLESEARAPGPLSEAKSVCEIVANRDTLTEKRVIIAATLGEGPHQRILYDDNCSAWLLLVSHSPNEGSSAARKLVEKSFKSNPTAGVPVTYSGIFVARVLISGCTKPTCYSYSLNDAQILDALPPRTHPVKM